MAHYFLGEAYGQLGQMSDAHYHLGLHYRNIKEFKNARFHMERAVEKTNDPGKKEKIREILDEMRKHREKKDGPPGP